jgi:acetyltransferase
VALDARVVLHEEGVKEEDIPPLAIRPYPSHYCSEMTTKKGTKLIIRPIRPEDEPLLVKFHESLSDRTVYKRFLSPMLLSQRTSHERLSRICFIDYDREMALVAERKESSGERTIVAVGRLTKMHGANDASLTLVVSDEEQGQGIGIEIVGRLVEVARAEKLSRILAYLADHPEMQHVVERFGFRLNQGEKDMKVAVYELT